MNPKIKENNLFISECNNFTISVNPPKETNKNNFLFTPQRNKPKILQIDKWKTSQEKWIYNIFKNKSKLKKRKRNKEFSGENQTISFSQL